MKTLILVLVLACLAGGLVTGCKSSGSRDFVPGRGWVPND